MQIASGVDIGIEQLLLQCSVEQFLYTEARLLDDRKFHEWLELFTEDCHYWMPIRSTRARDDQAAEFTGPHEHSYFDDSKDDLRRRVAKLDTGFSWSEDPPSRTRHIVTNVQLRPSSTPQYVHLDCDFLVYRSRLSHEENFWIGRREDQLRREEGRWRVAVRRIFLDQVLLTTKNISTFL